MSESTLHQNPTTAQKSEHTGHDLHSGKLSARDDLDYIRRIRWSFLSLVILWILAGLALPTVVFLLARNVVALYLFGAVVLPVFILAQIIKYLFPRNNEKIKVDTFRRRHPSGSTFSPPLQPIKLEGVFRIGKVLVEKIFPQIHPAITFRPRNLTRSVNALHPPRYQQGMVAPYVFSEDIPWGWLEYRNGRFQGQQVALKRVVETIGRDKENDICLDDDLSSRHHAELAWEQDLIYITDCDSLNGILLNGRRIRGTTLLEYGDLIEIGSYRFSIVRAGQQLTPISEQNDPLSEFPRYSSPEQRTGDRG